MARRVLLGFFFGLAIGPALADCSADRADLVWPGGKAGFSVEIADTADERALGLMFREKMPASVGMLFVYERSQTVAFWMKNTLLPLDMLFMDEAGRVQHIARDARPGDETPIPGGDGIRFVLEINGGLAARLGIPEGAALVHPAVDQDRAAARCQ